VGARSARAMQVLRSLGYANAFNVAGGFAQWRARGLPYEVPSALDADALERYSRHLLLPEIGEQGQQRLGECRVLLVGAGGLGSPAAFYLAAAGVGCLRIVDDDRIERSNLQRQVLHQDVRVGAAKVASAEATLSALNPRVAIEPVPARVNASNVMALLDGVDLVLDGADNFATRYVLNEACVRTGIPLVYGAVQRFEGQASVFWPGHPSGEAPCYRCLFPEPPRPEDAPNCAEAGVFGPVVGVVGALAADLALRHLAGESVSGTLITFDARGREPMRQRALRARPDCPLCGARPEIARVDVRRYVADTAAHD